MLYTMNKRAMSQFHQVQAILSHEGYVDVQNSYKEIPLLTAIVSNQGSIAAL